MVSRACCVAKLMGVSVFGIISILIDDPQVRLIGMAILLNGYMCHTLNTKEIIVWDVFCNVMLAIYGNARTTWQPYTLVLTVVAACGFVLSSRHTNSYAVHVALVQLPMAIALVHLSR